MAVGRLPEKVARNLKNWLQEQDKKWEEVPSKPSQ